ncbi:MAG TPA: hypothetical protein VK511_00630 [Gemmatimonadaceae bacterium]|nr:hypothetical protein [Gemmatimonadaceae bacterium]
MGTASMSAASSSKRRSRVLLGWVFLALGLLGHVLAARAIGGTRLAFRDHIAGFVILSLVSWAIIGPLGWKFWRGRGDITVLAVGALQAILGFVVYLQRFTMRG